VCLILGDNIFYGRMDLIREAISCGTGAIVFAYRVRHPERYGVIEFDRHEQPIRIVEKPQNPPSSYVVTGLYMYGPEVVNIVKTCRPSARGELEITSVNNAYLKKNELKVVKFTRGVAWLDTGTHGSLLDASNFVEALDSRQALKLSCLEEIAYRMQYIDREGLRRLIKEYQECDYKQYLKRILEENDAQ
jgi:glucose-1-phosphate thymidylyltransferase